MICLCEYLKCPAGTARKSAAVGVRILECRGLDDLAVIPDRIGGLPVVELAPYLFSEHGRYGDTAPGETFLWSAERGSCGAAGWEAERESAQLVGRKVGQGVEREAERESVQPDGRKAGWGTERESVQPVGREVGQGAEREAERESAQPAGRKAEWEMKTEAGQTAEMESWEDLPPLRGGRLKELRLPAHLKKVGAYALYNCENLRKLEFYSTTLDWGAGVFTGCRGVEQLTVHVDEERKSCLREVLAELRQTLEVVYLPEGVPREGTASGVEKSAAASGARLIFPEFFEEAVENTPARILVTETHGCGQKYRNAFVQTQFQFKEYDSLFPHVRVQEPEPLTARLALERLMYPYRLEERYARQYREYLDEHALAAAEQAVAGEDMQALEWIFAHIAFDGAQFARLLDAAGRQKRGAVVSFLMDQKRAAGGVGRKRFSL